MLMRLFLYADTQTSLVNVDNKRNLLSVVFFWKQCDILWKRASCRLPTLIIFFILSHSRLNPKTCHHLRPTTGRPLTSLTLIPLSASTWWMLLSLPPPTSSCGVVNYMLFSVATTLQDILMAVIICSRRSQMKASSPLTPTYSSHQDHLIYSAFLGAISFLLQPILPTATTAAEIWTYAKPSRAHWKQSEESIEIFEER